MTDEFMTTDFEVERVIVFITSKTYSADVPAEFQYCLTEIKVIFFQAGHRAFHQSYSHARPLQLGLPKYSSRPKLVQAWHAVNIDLLER